MSNTNEQKQQSFLLPMLPLLLILCIIPLIVKMYVYDPKLEKYSWFAIQDNTAVDFFLYYKQQFLIGSLILMLVILIYYLITKKVKLDFPLIFIPIGLYGLLAILSSIASPWSEFSFSGIHEQFESLWVLLAYCVMVFFAYSFVKTENHLNWIFNGFRIMLGILCILGFTQVLGVDFLSTDIGKKIITTQNMWDNLDSIVFTFGKGRVYLTMYNPNYVGVLASLAIPLLLVLVLFAKSKKYRMIDTLLIIGLLICVIGAQSKSAFIALGITLLLEAIFFRNYVKKYWKIILGTILALSIIFVIFDTIGGHTYTKGIKYALTPQKKVTYSLSDISLESDHVSVTFNDNKMNIQYTVDSNGFFNFSFKDGTGEAIATHYDTENSKFVFDDERFSPLTIQPNNIDNHLGFGLIYEEHPWYFSNQFEDGKYQFYNGLGKWTTIESHENLNLFSDGFFSGRGYIWNKTIPLLKDYIFLGSGPDTFALAYPQEDYVQSYNAGYENMILTKPHNLYLQIGVQTGVLSLICFLTFFIWYFIMSLKLYWNNQFSSLYAQMGVAIFLGTTAYIITGLSNDSTTTVAPMFWIMMGIGISMNYIIKKQNN